MTPERLQLAAEHALGLAEAPAGDADFYRESAAWAWRLAPLLDEVEPADPPLQLWARIDGAIAAHRDIRRLERQVGWWKRANFAALAAAAALAGVVLLRPAQLAPPPAPAPAAATPAPMVAMLGDDQGTKLVANWDPASGRLVLAIAGTMPSDPGKAHELWVIPDGGKPVSLGTMGKDPMSHMELADALARLLQQGATIAISVEPMGGSPSGAPTGPVIAAGKLQSA